MTSPRVSVLIVSYNQEQFLGEAIESVLAQDYPQLEIVIADDASTDGTVEIIKDYERRYPDRIRSVLGETNVGITRNHNRGLAACTGDLIAFLDGDDLFLPGKISAQVKWFGNDPKRVLCGHQLEVFYDDDSRPPHKLTRRLFEGVGADAIIRDIPYGKSSVMLRADRLPPHKFEESLPQISDLLMWVEIVGDDGRFGFAPGTLGRYRRHSHNLTNDQFGYLDQMERYLQIVSARYPQFADAVEHAVTRRLFYDPGVVLLGQGRKAEARERFIEALRREPLFAKAWIRIAQTML